MLVERSPLFHLYKEYSEYKFYFRKSHENFATFIHEYEQMRQKIDENIFMKCSRLQIQILDLLAASNLASDEDVETVINSLENLKHFVGPKYCTDRARSWRQRICYL